MTATPRRLALFFLLSLVWSVSSCWPANSKAKPLRYREQHLPKKSAEQLSAAASVKSDIG
jgi:hypothetical protein